MQVKKHYDFNIEDSLERIKSYMTDSIDAESVSKVPTEDEMTYGNGYYVKCCAVFVDIRDSSLLTYEETKKNVSKIYRSFVSEITAVMQSLQQCKHINIVGDCVSGIFDAQNLSKDILEVFLMVARIHSVIRLLNNQLSLYDLPNIKVGIGVDYGNTLVVKAGYQGSGLDDLVWMGRVVNHAAHLGNSANKENKPIILCSNNFYNALGDVQCNQYNVGTVYCKSFLEEQLGKDRGGDFYIVYPSLHID